MYQLSHCPCCGEPIASGIPVVIAPFIRQRALATARCDGALNDCPQCGFRCYRDRYDNAEIAALYQGYRDENYLKLRRRHEPWYTRAVNAAIGGPEETARRNQRLEAFLRDCGVTEPLRTVLDWGGDRGQFTPTLFAERYVYDISGVEPVHGVVALNRQQLATRDFDLVILAHVLEHASDPIALLNEVLTTKARFLYAEVPYEPFQLLPVHNSAAYARWVRGVARSQAYPAVAFVSVLLRVKFGLLPPFAVLQQHEHLNYFTETTLARMLQRVGCEVVSTTSYRAPGSRGAIESLGVLVRTPLESSN